MAKAAIWSNVKIDLQSAKGADKAITAISKASPGVVTATHDYIVGDYVLLTVSGMVQLNGRMFRVSAISTTVSFTLEAEDTTLYDTFTATGSVANKITLGTSLGTVKGLTGSGGEFAFIDTTTVHDTISSQIPGIASAIAYNFDNIWDAADTGLLALKAASDLKAQRAFRFTFSDGRKMLGNGYVGATLVPTGNAQDLVTTSATLTLSGSPSYLAT